MAKYLSIFIALIIMSGCNQSENDNQLIKKIKTYFIKEPEIYTRFWEGVDGKIKRLRVPNGWLIRYHHNESTLLFLPDPENKWIIQGYIPLNLY